MDFSFPKKSWEKNEWAQLKNLTKNNIISLLKKDIRWEFKEANGGRYIYKNPKLPQPHDYLAIHYHPTEGFRDKGLLREILNQWCCTREDLKKWKVIK
jgi:hypothetical protein